MEESISLKSFKSLTTETDNSSDSDSSSKKATTREYMSYTLMLLSRLSLHPEPIDGLANPMMIKSLLTYIKYTKNCTASEILMRITR